MDNVLLVDLVVVPEKTGGLEEQILESITMKKKEIGHSRISRYMQRKVLTHLL